MWTRFAGLTLILVLNLLLIASGCFDRGGSPPGSRRASSGGGAEAGNGNGGARPARGPIVISPPEVLLEASKSSLPTQSFRATRDGTDITADVTWRYERPDVGAIDSAGTFTPTGTTGGIALLSASLGASAGSTHVAVRIHVMLNPAQLTPAAHARFDDPTGGPDPSMNVVYPYDRTVFPLGVQGPAIQWTGSSTGDQFRLQLVEKYYDYTEYFTLPMPTSHLVSDAHWAAITHSGSGSASDPLHLTLARLNGTSAYQAVQRTLVVAQGTLQGSIYYLEVPDGLGPCTDVGGPSGALVRLGVGASATEPVLESDACVGAHAVSRDGRTLAAAFTSSMPPFAIQTRDLTQSPAGPGALSGGKSVIGTLAAFNAQGDRILASDDHGAVAGQTRIRILDTWKGAVHNDDAFAPFEGCGEPAWSPDGTKIAAICGLSGAGWIFNAKAGYLTVADVAADGVKTGNAKAIVPLLGSPGRPAFPSFAPSSQLIAFGRPLLGEDATGQGDLWISDFAGNPARRLASASGDSPSHTPSFAPVRAGGYNWLVFTSTRDYGITLTGAKRPQLWVVAIDDPPATDDPSHPPFYLRAQNPLVNNESPFFARPPCRPDGAPCALGIECCNGQCVVDPDTKTRRCAPPLAAGQCAADGNGCAPDAPCCTAGAACKDGFCEPPFAH